MVFSQEPVPYMILLILLKQLFVRLMLVSRYETKELFKTNFYLQCRWSFIRECVLPDNTGLANGTPYLGHFQGFERAYF